MNTNITIIYKSNLFSKKYAVLLDPKTTIPPSSLLNIYNFKGWRYLEGGNLVDFSSLPKNIMAFSIDKQDIHYFSGVYTGIIVLAYFKRQEIHCKKNLYTITDQLELVAYKPEVCDESRISVIQLDYELGRLFNYDPENTIGTDLSKYKEINLGLLTVPDVKYSFFSGNDHIKQIIIDYTKNKLSIN